MSDSQPMVIVKDLHKAFRLPHDRSSGLKQKIVNVFNSARGYETQHVLNDISFEIKKGEFFGIVGRNGSGKSTLLKLLAGIYTPDSGMVKVNGSLTPFIELGVGFNPELTGRENIYMNGALLGFDRKQMDEMYAEIVSFAELEKFMDQKLKNYSSGMQVRLAFSIAIRAKTDILLIDEVLAVGDAAFQTKCFDYFYELKKSDTTVIFVSHDQGSLERFCDRGVLIDQGKMVEYGKMDKILQGYSRIVMRELISDRKSGDDGTRSDYAEIKNIKVANESNVKSNKFLYGDQITLSYDIEVKKDIVNPIFGITVWQKHLDKAVLATNTLIDGHKETGQFKKGEVIHFTVELPRNLNNGEYVIEPAIANESVTVFYDKRPHADRFVINGGSNPHSIISFEAKSSYNVKRDHER